MHAKPYYELLSFFEALRVMRSDRWYRTNSESEVRGGQEIHMSLVPPNCRHSGTVPLQIAAGYCSQEADVRNGL
jgi:hypothetical protein